MQSGTLAALAAVVVLVSRAKGETVAQFHGDGPWTTTAHDPCDKK